MGIERADEAAVSLDHPFALVDADDRNISSADFPGRWLLIYFGYTHCPDICPTTLTEIVQTLDLLGEFAAEVQPLFITIDPERDTPDALDAFVKSFDARIIGLTGTTAEIAAVGKNYKAYYAKLGSSSGDRRSYLMEHSTFVYVMGPDGNYATLFAPRDGQRPDQMALRLRELIASSRNDKSTPR